MSIIWYVGFKSKINFRMLSTFVSGNLFIDRPNLSQNNASFDIQINYKNESKGKIFRQSCS